MKHRKARFLSMVRGRFVRRGLTATGLCLLLAAPLRVQATWSIVMADTRTGELAVGSATCVPNIDLSINLPILIPGVGVACAQALVSVDGSNQQIIHDELMAGRRPDKIIEKLAFVDPLHLSRQYGIVDLRGRMTSFTGSSTFPFAGHRTGTTGTIAYAVQGNILTGQPVVLAAENAILNTAGGLPEKLMAAMEAARALGGDGRCSCLTGSPTSCGVPPLDFEKSAHVGFMFISRAGDASSGCDPATGCASSDYFLRLNVPFADGSAPDPVLQLQDLFDAWRADLIGRPDAVESSVVIEPASFPADGQGSALMTIQLRDYQQTPVDDEGWKLTVTHAPDSAATSQIGPVVSLGGGAFEVSITGTTQVGRDRFHVTVNDGIRPVILMPLPELLSLSGWDQDADGYVTAEEYAGFSDCLLGPGIPLDAPCAFVDANGDGAGDLLDFGMLQRDFTGPPCVELEINQSPQSTNPRCGNSFLLSVTVAADPPASHYQWTRNGEAISGANGSIYLVPAAGNDDAGTYTVRVFSTCGMVESLPAQVTLTNPPCP